MEEKATCKWKVVVSHISSIARSPTFSYSGSSVWCMKLISNSILVRWWIDLYFVLLSLETCSTVKVKCTVTIQTDSEGPSVCAANTTTLKPKQDLYLTSFDGYLFNKYEKCIICGEVTVFYGTPVIAKSVPLNMRLCNVTKDLSAVLDSEELSDVVLCAGGTVFRAHRVLLSARSPVFTAMFHHDSRESQAGRVDIEDVDPETMRELLRFFYTGTAPGVQQMAGPLLVAADKYRVVELKQLCEQELVAGLTTDNATAAGVVALRHSCERLKLSVVSFIAQNIASVLGTEGWADAVTNHSKEVVELSRLIADKSTECC